MSMSGEVARDWSDDDRPQALVGRHWSLRPPREISEKAQVTVLELQRLQRAFDREFPKAAGRSAEAWGKDPVVEAETAVLRPSALIGHLRGLKSVYGRQSGKRADGAASPLTELLAPFSARASRLLERREAGAAWFLLRDGGKGRWPVVLSPFRYLADKSSSVTRTLHDVFVQAAASGVDACRLLGRNGSSRRPESATSPFSAQVQRALAFEFRSGLGVFLVVVLAAGGWAIFAPLAGAVAVAGSLVVETNVKKVQHANGGIVAQIGAYDGMHVLEGEPVVQLDGTQTRISFDLVTKQLDQVRARLVRLVAECDGAEGLSFPPELMARNQENDIAQLVASERSLFATRARWRDNQKKLLRNRTVQLESEIKGFEVQTRAETAQSDLIKSELRGVQTLHDRQLVSVQRLTTLQREAARLDGTIGQMSSARTQAQTKIDEAALQIDQADQTFRSEVLKDLREAQDKEAELTERSAAAKDQLDRMEIRAPVSGVVHQLAVHTVGGVVAPAEMIMEIVPDADDLQVEARLPPNEIDHVHLGQTGLVRFSAFNQRTTPQVEGAVSYVSADLSHDGKANAGFYTVRVALSREQRQKLGSLQLVSGMPAEVFLQTGSRTMMSYLLKPITDQLKRTISEP